MDVAKQSDDAWRSIKRNASIILGERAVFGIVNLAAAALAVRAIGVEGFGIVALLQAYARFINGLLKFQSWAAVTRYGPMALQDGRLDDFRRLLGLTFRVDVISWTASIAVAVIATPWAAQLFDWPPDVQALAPWYSVSILFMTSGTAVGFLRMYDRFSVLAEQHAINAVIRLVGAGLVLLFGGGPFEIAIVWATATVISGAYMIGVATLEARRRRCLPRLRGSWSDLAAGFPRIWRFMVVTNISSLLEAVVSHGTTLVVGAMLGTGAAGLYALVRQVTDSLNKLKSMLGPIVFPEMSWFAARGDRAAVGRLVRKTLWRGALLLGGAWLVLAIGGETALTLLFGDEAAEAKPLLLVAGLAAAVKVCGFALDPAMLSLGKINAMLTTTVGPTVVFVPLMFGLLATMGLVGIGWALLARSLLTFGLRLTLVRRAVTDSHRSRRSAPTSGDEAP